MPQKKTWNSWRKKNNIYCQYKLPEGKMLRSSVGRNQKVQHLHRCRRQYQLFSPSSRRNLLFPISLWHTIDLQTLQSGVSSVIYHNYSHAWLHCDQSYQWMIGVFEWNALNIVMLMAWLLELQVQRSYQWRVVGMTENRNCCNKFSHIC